MFLGMQVIFYWTYLARHLCWCFDSDPSLQPAVTTDDKDDEYHIALSRSQQAQIQEIFDLFDTDGGGTIDRGELQLAMVSLGFYSKKADAQSTNTDSMKSIIEDGTVTLQEFSSLMMGELSGTNPKNTLRSLFTVLSRPDGNSQNDSLITKDKLLAVCDECKVFIRLPT